MAQSKDEILARAKERSAKNRAAKKEAVANQGAENAPETAPNSDAADQNSTNQASEQNPIGDSEQNQSAGEDQSKKETTEKKETKPTAKKEAVIVTSPFRDKDDFNKTWGIGDDISHFDKKRLEKIIELKLAEKK